MKPFTLSQYSELVVSLPVPTTSQMHGFARFVSGAHSWYKVLSLLSSKGRFQFFLNPAAGMQIVSLPEWKLAAEPRMEPGSHYSSLCTAEYRERFGYLDFKGTGGRSAPAVIDPSIAMRRELPSEIIEAGRALVSGLIHTCSTDLLVRLDQEDLKACKWPEESGGQQQFEKILSRIAVLKMDSSQRDMAEFSERSMGNMYDIYELSVDFSLNQLVEPERRRQQADMVAAMKRVCDLVGVGTA